MGIHLLIERGTRLMLITLLASCQVDSNMHLHPYNAWDLYAPVLKPAEWRLLAAIAAANKTYMFKYDTTQAFLYGDVVEDLYTRAPDRWPELIPEGHCLKLKKNIYGTRQAARAWHLKLSTWMEGHQYLLVNNEKTIFMKWDGDDFILHGIFVDCFASIQTSEKLKLEFEELYAADFDVTGGPAEGRSWTLFSDLKSSSQRMGSSFILIRMSWSSLKSTASTITSFSSRRKCQCNLGSFLTSVVASAGETDRDLAVTQFPRNCVPYNIIEF